MPVPDNQTAETLKKISILSKVEVVIKVVINTLKKVLSKVEVVIKVVIN